MAAVDFPSSPTPGQTYTQAGATWTWDGVKWVAQGTGTGIYLPLAGGVMTGDITLKGDPSAPLHPVTYRMVSNPNDNRIINGDMRIDQRNNGASGTANGYTVDRWSYGVSQASKGTWQRLGPGPTANGFPYCLNFTSSSAYALTASDYFFFQYAFEADAVSDFQWGTPTAQPVTLSFWVNASLSGTFGGSIRNATGTRSYPFSFSATNTWTKVVIVIPGDTAGTWVLAGNAASFYFVFDLGSGATNRAPAGAWVAGSYLGANGATSIVATNGASFAVTGVKLEIGSVATPFNRQSLAKSMADCQRYYEVGDIGFWGYSNASQTIGYIKSFAAVKRAAPTITLSSVSSGGLNAPAANGSVASITVNATGSITGGVGFTCNYQASAEL